MAADDGDKGLTPEEAAERRAALGGPPRRKVEPITIDLTAKSVRIEQPASTVTPEPTAAESPAQPAAVSEPEATAKPVTEPGIEQKTASMQEPDGTPAKPADTQAGTDSKAPAMKPATPEEAPAITATATHDVWPRTIAAALIGGAIGLIGAYGIASLGLWPGMGNTATSAQMATVEARLAAAEAKVGPSGAIQAELEKIKSTPSIPGVTIADVQKILDPFTSRVTAAVAHMDDLDRKIAGEQAIVRGEVKAAKDATAAQIATFETRLTGGSAEIGKMKADVDALKKDLADTQGKLGSALEALGARLKELDARSAADVVILRGTAREMSEATTAKFGMLDAADVKTTKAVADIATDTAALRKAIDGLGARIGAIDDVKRILDAQSARLGTVDEAKKVADGVAASLWIIDQRMANLQARLTEIDALKTRIDGDAKQIAAIEARVTPVEAKVGGLDAWAKQGLAARRQALATIALASLKSAADTGRPFANELVATKAVIGETVDLSALDAYAAKGLMTDDQIIDGFRPAARRMAESPTPASGSEGVLGALLSHATQSVKIRSATAEPGETTGARLARIDAKLKAHDLDGALTEWQALPEPARVAAADWGNALKTHVEGTKAVTAISDKAMKTLTVVSQ